ncbi:histone-like nucleoid-structuring protein Lsr2 [Streptomyces ardesiacus]|uniref:histone-like nucleoid-structuring protein Lsr2 n=1 Tax=Streptomyces ardesiacus TaxID=285564 RepID=UPI00381F8A1A
MAQKTQILLIDDIDGGEADETLTFALDGKTYEIDLKEKNAAKLRKALEPFVAAGRKTGRVSTTTRSRTATKSSSSSGDTATIRAWAKENGFSINDRGRVPANVREAYEKATG